MKRVITEHKKRYPQMEIRDVLKLIYQSEFGGGHMIEDKEASLEWIKKEYVYMQKNHWPVREGFCEEIGDGMCRVYLDCLTEGLEPETLNEIFVLSANVKTGSITRLEAKLQMFVDLCTGGELPFEKESVEQMITEWKEIGYPAIHHSEAYRDNYFPAYRVVLKKYAERLGVMCTIDKKRKEDSAQEPFVVAIDGTAGAGKSRLGGILKEVYACNLFHMDDFFLQPHQRTEERFAEPGGNVDYERFKKEVIDQLNNPQGLIYQPYDCGTQSLARKQEIEYKPLVVIEGAYALHPYFEDRADLAFFMDIPEELQVERIRNRNGEWMLKRFVEEWIPMERKYFEAFDIKEKGTHI